MHDCSSVRQNLQTTERLKGGEDVAKKKVCLKQDPIEKAVNLNAVGEDHVQLLIGK